MKKIFACVEKREREKKSIYINIYIMALNKCRRQYRELEQLWSRILYIVYAFERALRLVIMSVF